MNKLASACAFSDGSKKKNSGIPFELNLQFALYITYSLIQIRTVLMWKIKAAENAAGRTIIDPRI
jgi:hypothetical protein